MVHGNNNSYHGVGDLHYSDTLSSLPTYLLSVIKMPKNVEDRIDRIRKHFFWKGANKDRKGYHLISWKRITRLIEQDGLGIIDLTCFGKALKAKGLWNLVSSNKATWTSLVRAKFLNNEKSLSCLTQPKPSKASPFWRDLISIFPTFMSRCKVTLGKGC